MPVSPEDGSMLVGFFEAADACRVEAEKKWGSGRLEILTGLSSAPLLARFRGQQARWRKALEDCWTAEFVTRDALSLVEQKTAAMQRAWGALDVAAEEAGHRPVAPWVWEARLADGGVVALVQSDAEAGKVIAEGRHVAVYTAKEVAGLIDMIPEALRLAKAVFPGAKLQAPSPYRRSSAEAIPWDDPIPFGGQGVSI
jgi:hypothetical protein